MLSHLIVLLLSLQLQANLQPASQPMYEVIDVLHYRNELNLTQFTTGEIKGKSTIVFTPKASVSSIFFDLASINDDNKGMRVKDVQTSGSFEWEHLNDKLHLEMPAYFEKNKTYALKITYEGTPRDGLIISKNKHKDHTAFGDNWPNRAHHWFPCTDHPADKATVEFLVTYPGEYDLIANGELIENSTIDKKTEFSHWKSTTVLPTKVMVIGLAEFAVSDACVSNGVEVSSWVFKPQKKNGFNDYAPACDILSWFTEKIGDYPYAKLANVQSKTRYGGMENASCIFYYEESVTGKQEANNLIAHEIAHQWFGNSATEKSWEHIWLSEGFATYLTDIYVLENMGIEAFRTRMIDERKKVIGFYERYKAPVIDTAAANKNLNMLLNPNSYQKGAWVLHMLRLKLGDEVFWKGIRKYYDKFKFGNASTSDFVQVMEEVSDHSLNAFFRQWLYQEGHPKLAISYKRLNAEEIELQIEQLQEGNFEFELEISLGKAGNDTIELLEVEEGVTKAVLKCREKPEIKIDPEVKLLVDYAFVVND